MPDPLGQHLWAIRATYRGVAPMATALGVSRLTLSRALNHAEYPPRLLLALGWERVVTYRPKGAETALAASSCHDPPPGDHPDTPGPAGPSSRHPARNSAP